MFRYKIETIPCQLVYVLVDFTRKWIPDRNVIKALYMEQKNIKIFGCNVFKLIADYNFNKKYSC